MYYHKYVRDFKKKMTSKVKPQSTVGRKKLHFIKLYTDTCVYIVEFV